MVTIVYKNIKYEAAVNRYCAFVTTTKSQLVITLDYALVNKNLLYALLRMKKKQT